MGASAASPRPSPHVVYLGGLGRSGSTLIERLLGELPGVCAVGEIVHMWRRGVVEGERCGCGEPFPSCRFWRSVGATAFGGWDKIDPRHIAELHAAVDRNRFIPMLAAPALPPRFGNALREYVSYYMRLYAAIADTAGCQAIVDSSKHASLAFCLRWCPGLDVRVVHVVRDSRAVAHSWTKRVARPDTWAAPVTYMTRYSPALSALQWNMQNAALHLLACKGMPTLLVRYEDLVRAPHQTVREIAAFAGLSPDVTALRFLGSDGTERWADLGPAHTASGNPMRFATGRIPIRPDEGWRTHMPIVQRWTVTMATLPLLARYGYTREAA
jgi:Sulfotransferase family